MDNRKRSITPAVLTGILVPSLALTVLSHANFWATVRAVDALVLFVAGVSVGIAIGFLVQFARKP